jgi:hypothetical protein
MNVCITELPHAHPLSWPLLTQQQPLPLLLLLLPPSAAATVPV